jgi:hypothetical protein
MRIFYTLTLTLFVSWVLCSQNITITPDEVTTSINLEEFENVGYAKLKNTSNQTLTLIWKREIIKANSNWEISICDKNNCYLPFIETREVVLGPGEESNLDVHVRHNGQKDNGEIKMLVQDKANPADTVSAMFIFTAGGSSSTKKVAFGDQIKVWPNPAQNNFSISDPKLLGKVEVLNMLGNVVKVYDPRTTTQFDISDLINGIYFVRMISKNDPTKSKTIRLRKA